MYILTRFKSKFQKPKRSNQVGCFCVLTAQREADIKISAFRWASLKLPVIDKIYEIDEILLLTSRELGQYRNRTVKEKSYLGHKTFRKLNFIWSLYYVVSFTS